MPISKGASDITHADDGGGDDVDPSAYSLDPEGLKSFLSAIDGPCDPPTSPTSSSGADSREHEYRATSIAVEAASTLRVPIHVQSPGSEVRWEAQVEELDVDLIIVCTRVGGGGGNAAAASGIDASSANVVERLTAAPQSNDGTPRVPRSGSFVVADAPATVMMQFNNSYSWITPKRVSYKIVVTPPRDKEQEQRAQRASRAMAMTRDRLSALEDKMAELEEKGDEKRKQLEDQEGKLDRQTEQEAEAEEKVRESEVGLQHARVSQREAEEAAQEAKGKLAEKTRQMEEIDRQIDQLKFEKQEMEKQASDLNKDLFEKKAHVQSREENVGWAKEDVVQKTSELHAKAEEVQKTREELEGMLGTSQVILEEEAKLKGLLDFLQHQIEQLKLRL